MKIMVMKGGISPEREVSLNSGKAVADQLRLLNHEVHEVDPADYPDPFDLISEIRSRQAESVFNALHGGSGENGELQAVFSACGIKVTGSPHYACVLAMDKYASKLIAESEGVPVPKAIILREDLLADYTHPEDYGHIFERLGLPLVVKPNDAGSSVGIQIVRKIKELKPAVADAFRYSDAVLLEEYVSGRELTVTVLDGVALPVVEIKPLNGWFDYQNKYTKGNTEYIAPAELDNASADLIKVYAVRIWKALRCSGYARVDFRYDGSEHHFLEVNTLPGMTALSLTPMAAKAAGIDFGQLLERILQASQS